MHRVSHYIDGAYATDEAWIRRQSPLDSSVEYSIACGGRDTVDRAVAAAARAQVGWATIPPDSRAAALASCADWLVERYGDAGEATELKLRIGRAMGKPLAEADIEVVETSDFVRYFCEVGASALNPEILSLDQDLWPTKQSTVEYEPFGVVAVIKPWNYPLEMIAWSAFPAMLAGNSVIIKPSEKAADVALAFAEMAADCGFPNGVLNIVQGDGSTGKHLVDHSGVDFVSFTGSVPVGREIAIACAKRLAKCSLELGGNDAAIVLQDADLELAANGLVWGAFCDAGQVCVGIKRAYVHQSIHDALLDKAKARVAQLRPIADVGPIVDESQYQAVTELILDATDRGASRFDGIDCSNPLYLPPVILTNLNPDSRLLHEECFGPVLPLIPFDDVEDAIRMANASTYGLAASIWTTDRTEARSLSRQLHVGMTWINDVNVAFPQAPWGGVKLSGSSFELGSDAVRHFCRPKSICEETSDDVRRAWWYPY